MPEAGSNLIMKCLLPLEKRSLYEYKSQNSRQNNENEEWMLERVGIWGVNSRINTC